MEAATSFASITVAAARDASDRLDMDPSTGSRELSPL